MSKFYWNDWVKRSISEWLLRFFLLCPNKQAIFEVSANGVKLSEINGGGAMKTIGLIGGMSWESTVTYYTRINQLINE